MPQLGESVAEGTIGKWLKQPGDSVAKYEPLLEVITDKVNAEVPSPFEGVLKEILAEEGATVPNNAEIAIIETAEEAGAGAASAEAPAAAAKGPAGSDETTPAAQPATAPASTPTAATADAAPASAPAPVAAPVEAPAPAPAAAATASAPAAQAAPTATAPAGTGDPDARMTPAVRRLLREHALQPNQIVGTGGGGRITRDDVLAVVESIRTGGAPAVPVMAGG